MISETTLQLWVFNRKKEIRVNDAGRFGFGGSIVKAILALFFIARCFVAMQ